MAVLVPGQRVDLDGVPLEVRIEAGEAAALAASTALLVVGFEAGGRLAERFGTASGRARELRPGLGFSGDHALSLELGSLPQEVVRVVIIVHALTAPGGGWTLNKLGGLRVALGSHRLDLDLTDRGETAVLVAEVYRRGERWRLMANGQGFSGGLAAVGAALGVALPRLDAGAERPREDRGPPPGGSASGSGFAVTRRRLLTNHHVIDGAGRIEVAGEHGVCEAAVVMTDARNDIALLRIEREAERVVCFRDGFGLELGEDVVVLGFPLQGLLASGPQVSGGNVSALCGIGDDCTQFQFSAPIASGASGGPILDSGGRVIGLVRAALNHEEIRRGGSTAENINFGVKVPLLRTFLGAMDIDPECAASGGPRSRAEVARENRPALFRVRCEY